MSGRAESERIGIGFIAKAALAVLAIWVLARGLWMVRDTLIIGFASILLAVFFSILVDPLERWVPRWAASLVTVLLFLALLVGFWIFAWPRMEHQVARVIRDVPTTVGRLVDQLQQWWHQLVPGEGPAARQAGRTLRERIQSEAMTLVAGALPVLNTVVGAVTGALVTFFAAAYLVIEPGSYLGGLTRLAPESVRPRLRDALTEAGTTLRRWIAGKSVSMLVIFLMTTAGLYLLGVPAALVLGLIAGALAFIPFIGPTLSALPALAMGLTVSPILMLWVGVLYLGIQLVESNLLTPLVMREAVRLPPAATILFQLAMSVLFGFLGLFFAVPLFAAVRVLVERLYIEPLEADADA